MDLLGAGLAPLEGGHSGETFVAEAGGERSVVRIYARSAQKRGPNVAEIDAAVLRLVRGLLPVPEVKEVRRGDPDAATPPLLVTSYLPGERLDLVLPAADDELRGAIGTDLGRILATLGNIAFLRAGTFVDGELRVAPMSPELTDLVTWVEAHCDDTALSDWPGGDFDALRALADEAQAMLDTADRVCLVHSDFNPKNILVDPESGAVTGLLDWEFSHAGNPYADLGNLLRFDRGAVFAQAAWSTYRERVAASVPEDLLGLARAADLWALVDLAARRDANPVASRAHDLLLAIARAGDLHATP